MAIVAAEERAASHDAELPQEAGSCSFEELELELEAMLHQAHTDRTVPAHPPPSTTVAWGEPAGGQAPSNEPAHANAASSAHELEPPLRQCPPGSARPSDQPSFRHPPNAAPPAVAQARVPQPLLTQTQHRLLQSHTNHRAQPASQLAVDSRPHSHTYPPPQSQPMPQPQLHSTQRPASGQVPIQTQQTAAQPNTTTQAQLPPHPPTQGRAPLDQAQPQPQPLQHSPPLPELHPHPSEESVPTDLPARPIEAKGHEELPASAGSPSPRNSDKARHATRHPEPEVAALELFAPSYEWQEVRERSLPVGMAVKTFLDGSRPTIARIPSQWRLVVDVNNEFFHRMDVSRATSLQSIVDTIVTERFRGLSGVVMELAVDGIKVLDKEATVESAALFGKKVVATIVQMEGHVAAGVIPAKAIAARWLGVVSTLTPSEVKSSSCSGNEPTSTGTASSRPNQMPRAPTSSRQSTTPVVAPPIPRGMAKGQPPKPNSTASAARLRYQRPGFGKLKR